MMLTQFCQENGFSIFDYYVDDGFSGLNFQRPGFRKLPEDVEAGRIDTIIAREHGRPGRDCTGCLIDICFKARNACRFFFEKNFFGYIDKHCILWFNFPRQKV